MGYLFWVAIKWAVASVLFGCIAVGCMGIGWWLGSASGYYDGVQASATPKRYQPIEPSEN